MTDSRNYIDKDKLREDVRRSMEGSGALFVNEKYKDKNYAYYWAIFDSRQPFKFQSITDLGYDYTKPEDMPGLLDSNAGHHKFSLVDDNGRICFKISSTQTQYLMRIPLDCWKAIQEIKHEDYNLSIKKLKHRLKNTQLSDGQISAGELNTTKGY